MTIEEVAQAYLDWHFDLHWSNRKTHSFKVYSGVIRKILRDAKLPKEWEDSVTLRVATEIERRQIEYEREQIALKAARRLGIWR